MKNEPAFTLGDKVKVIAGDAIGVKGIVVACDADHQTVDLEINHGSHPWRFHMSHCKVYRYAGVKK
jgi:transcription antitermination factor NusG